MNSLFTFLMLYDVAVTLLLIFICYVLWNFYDILKLQKEINRLQDEQIQALHELAQKFFALVRK